MDNGEIDIRTAISQSSIAPSAQPSNPDGVCEKCGRRPRYAKGGFTRKWCAVCLRGWQRTTGNRGYVEDNAYQVDQLIPPRFEDASLEDLPPALVEKFRGLPDDRGLLLWGEPGRGKSHAMCAFIRELWQTGWLIERVTWEGLALSIRDSFKAGSQETELDVIEPYVEADKLIIEDVGTTRSIGVQETDFSLRVFQVILDYRLEWCKATFITSNKSPEELGRSFDARIESRLMEACEIIELTGKDRRAR